MNKTIGVILGFVGAVVVSGLFLSMQVSPPIVNTMMEKRVATLVTGDADPGDASGFFYFMIYPHSADPATDYATNLSNATAYEFSDVGNESCTGETPYSTTFDIVVKCGVTDDDGYWSNNQSLNNEYNYCHITCADLGIGANTNMSEQFIGNSSTYAYYHYYMNNAGAGYTITEGQSFNVTSVKFYVMRIVP